MSGLHPYTRPPKSCSIQQLHCHSPLEELLLASDSKQATIRQQDQDQLFDLYITPYTEKDPQEGSHPPEDITILRFSKKDEGSTQLYRREDEEIERLKKIIQKKNQVIGELTEELRAVSQEVQGINRRKNHRQSRSTRGASQSRSTKHNMELQFLQKNNTELFEELRRCRTEKERLISELQQLKTKALPTLQLQLTILQSQNRELQLQNARLMKQIKQYIHESQREIKYVHKMRDLLIQKASVKEATFDFGNEGPKSKQLDRQGIRSTEQLPRSHHRTSVREEPGKQQRGGRCMSIGKLTQFRI